MSGKKELKIVVPEGLQEPIRVNAFRTGFGDSYIAFQFGEVTEGKIEVKSHFALHPKLVPALLRDLVETMQKYEKDFGYDFGLFNKQAATTADEKKDSKGE